MQVSLLTPERKLFEGEADHAYLPSSMGPIEIMSKHAPIVGSLGKGQLRFHTSDKMLKYDIEGGFFEVAKDKVVILANKAIDPTL